MYSYMHSDYEKMCDEIITYHPFPCGNNSDTVSKENNSTLIRSLAETYFKS